MDISLPTEPVYYYECSAGRYRLSYFLPPEELDRLIAGGHIEARVREDFPDGVDLDCTAPDFAEFEALYGYRPEEDPDELLGAFFAMFSSTRNWKRFRGTGLIPKSDLVQRLEPVTATLETEGVALVRPEPLRMDLPLAERRQLMVRQARHKTRVEKTLEKMDVKGIDSKQDLRQQSFSKIDWSEGESAAVVFDALNRQKKGG